MKSGNLNFLEASGPLQAGNGTVLLLRLRQLCLTDPPTLICIKHNGDGEPED
jgi:hypothetical protein